MKKTITLLLALACSVAALSGCDKQQNETEATEPPTEITAPSTEATDPPTQATVPPTEPTIQATEVTTEEYAEYNYFTRETPVTGEIVEFSIGYITRDFSPTSEAYSKFLSVPVYNDSSNSVPDIQRKIYIDVATTTDEMTSIIKDSCFAQDEDKSVYKYLCKSLDEISEYFNDDYYSENATIILMNNAINPTQIVKTGNALNVDCSVTVYSDSNIQPAVSSFIILFLQIKKSDLTGVNNISISLHSITE